MNLSTVLNYSVIWTLQKIFLCSHVDKVITVLGPLPLSIISDDVVIYSVTCMRIYLSGFVSFTSKLITESTSINYVKVPSNVHKSFTWQTIPCFVIKPVKNH